MEKEISNGTMLGIVLIALAVIIALGFGIFAIAKGTANEGVTKVQTNLINVQASEFTDYDQTVVTGTQAKSAISNFEGKAVAILISTAAWQKCTDNGGAAAGDTAFSGSKTEGDLPQVLYNAGDMGAINYNALLAASQETGGGLTYKNGKYIAEGGFYTGDAGATVQFHNNIGNVNKSGMTEYMNPGAKFNASLIEDPSGTTMGILFTQTGANDDEEVAP